MLVLKYSLYSFNLNLIIYKKGVIIAEVFLHFQGNYSAEHL